MAVLSLVKVPVQRPVSVFCPKRTTGKNRKRISSLKGFIVSAFKTVPVWDKFLPFITKSKALDCAKAGPLKNKKAPHSEELMNNLFGGKTG
jgi:hypothetical protein